MTFQKRTIALGISLLVLLLGACAPQQPGVPITGETLVPSTPSALPEVPPEAVGEAQRWLATQLGATVEQVQIIEAERAEWTDSCLGLGGPNESCLQVMTPGWRVSFEVNGQRYEVRTDETASTIRLASLNTTPGAVIPLENTLWRLVSFGTLGADTPLIEGSTATLILVAGKAGGTGGCNTYGGTYQLEGSKLSFDQIVRTEMACADEQVTEQEQRYFQALESSGRYELDGNQLRIWYGGDTDVLVFENLPTGTGGSIPAIETPGG